MTASPIWNPKNAAESLATLERNLDAKVIAVKEHVDELSGHAPRPEEVYTSTHTLCTVEDDHADRKYNYTPLRRHRIPSTPEDHYDNVST